MESVTVTSEGERGHQGGHTKYRYFGLKKKIPVFQCTIETANSRGTFFVEGADRLPVLNARRSINLRERESRGVQEVCPKLGVQNERDS